MPIGEFDAAARLPGAGSALLSTPMYWFYEMGQAALDPSRAFADATKLFFRNPANPIAHTTYGKSVAAAMELFERTTRRYGQPEWNIDSTVVGAERVPVHIKTVWERPFCRLLHFERTFTRVPRRPQPKLLIVAPMSGHYATLLRGTVEAFLPNHDVYITDWRNARAVPLSRGPLRPRRLCRLRHLDPAHAGRRRACDGGLPALGAGAWRRGADGGGQGPLRAAFHGADGRPDRHPGQFQRGQQARRGARARLVPPPTSSPRCRSRIRASCATSIRASCSCTASSA